MIPSFFRRAAFAALFLVTTTVAYGQGGAGGGPISNPRPLRAQDVIAALGYTPARIGTISTSGSGGLTFVLAGESNLYLPLSGTLLTTTGNGAALTALNASQLATGTVPAARLPMPAASTLGGVKSLAATSHQFLTSIGTDGTPAAAQPSASDISGLAASATTDTTDAANIVSGTLPPARLATPTGSTLGGVQSAAAPAHQWMTGISTSGVPQFSQPSYGDLAGIPAHMTWDGGGSSTARAVLTAQFTDGISSPLLDLVDNNMSSATPSAGFDVRFFGLDTNNVSQLGAIINGGLATRTAGSFKGDIDFIIYGPSAAVQAGFSLSGVYTGLVPINNNAYELGDSTLRWSNTYSVLGNFSGAVTIGGVATVATALGVGSTNTSEAIDLTGNMFLRNGGSSIYGSGAVTLQAGIGQGLSLKTNNGGTTVSISSAGVVKIPGNVGIGSTNAAEAIDLTGNLFLRTGGAIIYGSGAFTLQAGPGQGLTFLVNAGAASLSLASSGAAAFTAGITHGSSTLLTTSVALTNGAGANTGTLTNAPIAGNPTKWVPINDNGTTRYIPAW